MAAGAGSEWPGAVVIVLSGHRVRRRAPSAVEWRLIEYDPVTLVPIADLGSQWEPAAMAAVEGLNRVSAWVLAWVEEVTGHPVVLHPADSAPAPGAWHVEPRSSAPVPQDQPLTVARSRT